MPAHPVDESSLSWDGRHLHFAKAAVQRLFPNAHTDRALCCMRDAGTRDSLSLPTHDNSPPANALSMHSCRMHAHIPRIELLSKVKRRIMPPSRSWSPLRFAPTGSIAKAGCLTVRLTKSTHFIRPSCTQCRLLKESDS